MTSCVTVGMTLSYSLNIPLLHTEGKNPSVKDTPVRPRLYILWMFSRIWKSYNKSQWVWFLGHRQDEGGQRRQGSTNERNGKSLKLHLCFAFFFVGFPLCSFLYLFMLPFGLCFLTWLPCSFFWLGFLFAPLEFCFGFFSVILRMWNHVTAFKKLSTVGTNRHISVPEQHCRYFCSQIVCNWHGLALQYIDNQ